MKMFGGNPGGFLKNKPGGAQIVCFHGMTNRDRGRVNHTINRHMCLTNEAHVLGKHYSVPENYRLLASDNLKRADGAHDKLARELSIKITAYIIAQNGSILVVMSIRLIGTPKRPRAGLERNYEIALQMRRSARVRGRGVRKSRVTDSCSKKMKPLYSLRSAEIPIL